MPKRISTRKSSRARVVSIRLAGAHPRSRGRWEPWCMRALVINGPGSAQVEDVEVPVPGAGQVVVDVRRAGICGTDVELFTGQVAYFAQGKTRFPLRPGHEWCGVVSALGDGVDSGWLRARVTGDTM